MWLKKPNQKENIYTDEHLKLFTHTHTGTVAPLSSHSPTGTGMVVGVFPAEHTSPQTKGTGQESGHHRERHSEYTVYVQTESFTRSRLL